MEHYLHSLETVTKRLWDRYAVCNYGGDKYTYAQVAEGIEKLHIFFAKAGIRKGDKIAICASNSAHWAISFLAINTFEAVVVPLLSDFLPESAAALTVHSESVGLFVDKSIWDKISPEMLPGVKFVINNADYSLLWTSDGSIAEAFESMDADFRAKYPDGYSAGDVHYPTGNDKDLAVINYTSGTTSAPKGVMLRYECFSAGIDFAIRHIYCSEADSIVSMLPMGHIYGMVFEFLYPLSHGATVHFLGKTPAASTLLRAVGEVKPFLIITVPLVMEKIYKSALKPVLSKWQMRLLTSIPGIRRIIYNAIRSRLMATFGGRVQQFIMGGAALNPDVEKVFRKIRLPYTVGYGMTEASPLLAYAAPWDYVPGSCGLKVDMADVRIDSEDPERVAGEIQAKGVNICSGYFKNAEASAGAFTDDGFLHTGDLGTMDKAGNITIRGRSKNMILSANGQNIYPEEVESAVNSQEYVSESVVVDRAGKLVALVYLDSDSIRRGGLDEEAVSDIPEHIRQRSNRSLPSYSQIAKVEVVLTPFEKTPKMSIKRYLYK